MNGQQYQGLLDFSKPVEVPISHIDPRGWRRISVASERCAGRCSTCTCVSDLQILARGAAMGSISFGPSGGPLLSAEQIRILQSKKETSILDESIDVIDVRVDVPPAPLTICPDDQL